MYKHKYITELSAFVVVVTKFAGKKLRSTRRNERREKDQQK